jgi:hypothetical protein
VKFDVLTPSLIDLHFDQHFDLKIVIKNLTYKIEPKVKSKLRSQILAGLWAFLFLKYLFIGLFSLCDDHYRLLWGREILCSAHRIKLIFLKRLRPSIFPPLADKKCWLKHHNKFADKKIKSLSTLLWNALKIWPTKEFLLFSK